MGFNEAPRRHPERVQVWEIRYIWVELNGLQVLQIDLEKLSKEGLIVDGCQIFTDMNKPLFGGNSWEPLTSHQLQLRRA